MGVFSCGLCVLAMGLLGAGPEPARDVLVAFTGEVPDTWQGHAVEPVTPGVGRVQLDDAGWTWAEVESEARRDRRVSRVEPNLRFRLQGPDGAWLRRDLRAAQAAAQRLPALPRRLGA